jgi:glycerate 2-kinase
MTDIENRDALVTSPARDVALAALEAGIAAAHPERVVHETVSIDAGRLTVGESTYDLYPYRTVVVVGAGNAAAHVAAAIETVLGDRLDGGMVITDDPVDLDTIEVLPGDHPVPSERGVESTKRLLEAADGYGDDTLVLGLVTGGGSALMSAPAGDISLEDLRETTDALLRSGATIHEINAVRKHCSAIKGGQLADALAPATTVSLVFSDVVGNDLDVIASGPQVADRSTFADAIEVLDRYEVSVPQTVRTRLERGAAGRIPETPTADTPIFERVNTHVLADGFTALDAAAGAVAESNFEPLVLSSRIEGEARDVGATHAAIAEEMAATGNPVEPPAVLLSGGETTVSLTGDGHGGPNQEFALSAAIETDTDAVVAAVDTDGIDGNAAAAGAILEARDGFDHTKARTALDEHDVSPYLEDQGSLVITGQTGTNVNDLRVVVVTD